jgi:hypothetical protein
MTRQEWREKYPTFEKGKLQFYEVDRLKAEIKILHKEIEKRVLLARQDDKLYQNRKKEIRELRAELRCCRGQECLAKARR